MERKGAIAPPRLDGREVLTGPNPDLAKVKGVMFGGRKQFLTDNLGIPGFNEFVAKLSAYPSSAVATPHLFQKVAIPGVCVA